MKFSAKSSRLLPTLMALPQRFGRITTHKAYFAQIDGLRVLALIPVLVWHAVLRADRMGAPSPRHFIWGHIFPDGEAGVDLFFAVSGFIVARPFLTRAAEQYRQLGKFYLRRITRLGPPYLLILVLCFALLSLTHYRSSQALRFSQSQAPLWQSFIASAFYLHGLIFNAQPRLNPPLWSLEVEAQFYLVAPILIAPFLRIKRGWFALGGLGVVATLLTCTALTTGSLFDMPQGKTVLAYLQYFLVGIVCNRLADRADLGGRGADVGLLIGFLVLWFSGRYQAESAFADVLLRDVIRTFCIAAILNGALNGPFSRRLLGHPWMTLVGAMCYSIYLVHVPMMQAAAEPLGRLAHGRGEIFSLALSVGTLIPASLITGFGFYLVAERPCMDPQWPQKLWAALRGRPRVLVQTPPA